MSRLLPGSRLRRVFRAREWTLVLAVIAVVVVIYACGRGQQFASENNRTQLLRQIALLGTFAVGEAVVIIAGGIDLSVGSVIAMGAMLSALAINRVAGGQPDAGLSGVLVALGAGALLGLLTGLFHALLITRLRLPPFIATLSTLAGLRSVSQLITDSRPVPVVFDSFKWLADGTHALYFFVAAAVAVGLLLGSTRAGRGLRALGGNEDAARLSGLNTARLKMLAYCVCGMLAGIAGVLYASRSGQGDCRLGAGYELRAIAACVVGGCSLTGGSGSLSGVVLGVVLMETVLNGIGLVISHNATMWEGVVTGVVVVLAVTLNALRRES